ncbi:MAG: hypothetical protein HPY75_05590 [Actinobacteria bacterium]|nr:hypothetical protein [Actinomycetota bacterium]
MSLREAPICTGLTAAARPVAFLAALLLAASAVLVTAPSRAPSATVWTTPVSVSTTSTANIRPQICLDSAGNPHAVWIGNDGSTNRIYYACNTGAGWSAPVPISDNSATNPGPRIAVDHDDNPHVVWVGNDGSTNRIYYAYETGGVWSTPVVISTTSTSNDHPRLAVDAGGTPHVVWYGSSGHPYYSMQVYYASDPGGEWSNPVMLSAPGASSHYSPEIALDSGAYPHVVWYEAAGTYPIQYSFQTMGGWTGPETVSGVGGFYPVIALDTADVPHVSWYNTSATYNEAVYYSCRSGGTWSAAEQVSGSTTSNHYPRMALDSGGVPHITWNGIDGSTPYNYYACRTGGAWSSPVKIPTAGVYNYEAEMGLDSTGKAHVIWSRNDGGASGDQIYYSDNTAGTWSSAVKISTTSTDNWAALAVSPSGDCHVAISGTESGTEKILYTLGVMENPVPSISGIDPLAGVNLGVQSIDVSGSGFCQHSTVQLDDGLGHVINGNVTSFSDSELSADFDLTGAAVGDYTVRVTNPEPGGGTDTYEYFVIGYPAPVVTSIAPDRGVTGGTVGVTVGGQHFRDGAQVSLRKSAQTIAASGEAVGGGGTTISCSLDLAGAEAGAWDVCVENDDAKIDTLAGGFTVEHRPPDVTGINPSAGYRGQYLDDVVISGADFRNVSTKVELRRGAEKITAGDVKYVSASRITCDIPIPGGATEGPGWDVYVRHNDDGKSDILADCFSVGELQVRASVKGGHGAVSPASQNLGWGGTATIDLIPEAGYHVESITDNGVAQAVSDPYVITNVRVNHEVVVTFAPSAATWYLAEGCTGGDYETWVLVQNPNHNEVSVDLTFMTSSGPIAGPQDFVIPGNSRQSFNVNSYVVDFNVSTKVESTGGNVVCERAMYGGNKTWAHDSVGYTP